jgi:type II secretory pathway component PulF
MREFSLRVRFEIAAGIRGIFSHDRPTTRMKSGPRQKHQFHSEMAKLLEAGFDIRRAADVLRDTRLPDAQKALLDELHCGLDSGKTIAEAIGSHSPAVTGLERQMIRAGERGGRLAEAFRHLAEHFGMLATARETAIASLIYPLVILHLGILIASVPGAWMLGGVTKADIAANLVKNLLATYALATAGFFLLRFLWRKADTHPALDRWFQRLPWIGKARRQLAMARFCQVYHACLLSGVSMEETVRLSSDASHSGLLRDAGAQLAATAASGHPLGPVFLDSGAFPAAFARSYATAEESGTLDTDLARWAGFFQGDAAAAMRTASVMLPKACYLLILLFIGWKIVGFYSGYYQGLEQMLE